MEKLQQEGIAACGRTHNVVFEMKWNSGLQSLRAGRGMIPGLPTSLQIRVSPDPLGLDQISDIGRKRNVQPSGLFFFL